MMIVSKSVENLEKKIDQLQKEISDLKMTTDLSLETLNSSVDAIIRYDAQGLVQYLNPAFTKFFGWTFEELAGKRVDFVPKEALNETQKAIRRMKAGEKIVNFPTSRLSKDGQILNVAMSVASIFDKEDQFIGNVVIIRDETQRRQTEERLQKTKDEYIQLFNASVDAIVRYDSQGVVEY
ncbi:MAG: PAS domain S-box protein, partial [Desulfobacteraceae bacterium]|nr:PAS domain S-box protein [Desulfobacteraceae bacterium]